LINEAVHTKEIRQKEAFIEAHIPVFFAGPKIAGFNDLEISAAGRWYEGLRFTIGCNNFTDNGAPLIAGATEDNLDRLGRFVYFEVSKRF
jgi:hypothetical protein